jgi:LmbE family N-acetylglucosaminyl deacetylase
LLEITKIIEKYLKLLKPNFVFTHNENDINIDHQIVFKSTISACRPVNKKYLEKIFIYEVLSSTEWNTDSKFKPQIFIDITNSMSQKIKALKKYKNEILISPNSRSLEKMKSLAKYRGSHIGYEYAEAFQLFRSNKI